MSTRSWFGSIPWLRWLAPPGDSLVLEPGDQLDRFRILAALPRGGMGLAYRAHDRELGRDVALKVLRPDRRFDKKSRSRFVREARIASRATHPNIVTVFDLRKKRGHYILVMEYVRGSTLRDVIRQSPLDTATLMRHALQIAAGLKHLHHLGIIHRDIKPSNLLVSERGEIKLADFGISKVVPLADGSTRLTGDTLEDSLTVSGEILGTPFYMAPEQILGQAIDARVDLFAFGCVLFEMITGHMAFGADSWETIRHKILHREPEWPEDELPDRQVDLRPIVEKCLQKHPPDRWQSISEVETALREVRLGSEHHHGEEPDPERLWRDMIAARSSDQPTDVRTRAEQAVQADPPPTRRSWAPAGAIVLFVLLIATFGVWMMRQAHLPAGGPAETITITGRVVNWSDSPVAGALVTIDGYPLRATTTTDGSFRAVLPEEPHGDVLVLRVSHDSLASFTRLVPLSTALTDTLQVRLESLHGE